MTCSVELTSHKFVSAEIPKHTKPEGKVTRRRDIMKEQTDWYGKGHTPGRKESEVEWKREQGVKQQ